MEPQDNGSNKPDLPLTPPNPAQWWQGSQEPTNASLGSGQLLPPKPQPINSQALPQAPLMTATPQTANDKDLIENEWVEAAKRSLETHRGDPYNQSKAITLLRVDYMKKRYNKDIKVPEN